MENSKKKFKLISQFEPAGDQPKAIDEIVNKFESGDKKVTLLGVTGSGKTFTMAKVIEKLQKPTLIISHNKTLAAQLYSEFRDFFPDNAVEYFVSYYDYYQPEAYVPSKDLFIEKDAQINAEIERHRLSATSSLIDRKDVIVIATVSCIYGLGNPENFKKMKISFRKGKSFDMGSLKRHLISLQYDRNDSVLNPGTFRVRGDVFEIYPAYKKTAYRITFDWETVESITEFNPLTNETIEKHDFLVLYPAKHFVMEEKELQKKLSEIEDELKKQYAYFIKENKIVEAERLKTRVEYDIEMMKELGYCSGIENYSRILDGRKEGDRPAVLIDYFPDDFLTFIDESHVTIPQIGGMYAGDRSRKTNLVDFGFRLPSALDNRPLFYQEFDDVTDKKLYISATPANEERENSSAIVEQIIRPTGLLDPEIEIRDTEKQIEDLYNEIQKRVEKNERVLITTLTKRMSEDLTNYYLAKGLKVRYMHSEIETIERVEIIKELRLGEIDVLVGINLLREGLDMPEVSLVAILDADKIGFLRSATSLIQTIGRAARNENGHVIMYADRVSDAMKQAIDETNRRRKLQLAHNKKYNITPKTIKKQIKDILSRNKKDDTKISKNNTIDEIAQHYNLFNKKDKNLYVKELEDIMLNYAKDYNFEMAMQIRDEIYKIKGS